MSATIIQQGRFTSDGSAKSISIRSDVDWMEVYNSTIAADNGQTTAVGVQFYWQRGMDADTGIEYKKSDAANAAQLTTLLSSGGFTLGGIGVGPIVIGTSITKASPPVCTAAAHGYNSGDTVSLHNLTNMPQISAAVATFTVGAVTTNTFELKYFDTNTPNFVAETSFEVRRIPFFEWKGSWNIVSSVITGNTTQVQFTTLEPEDAYEVGTVLSFNISSEYGMTELNGLQGEILSHNFSTNTYTIAIDSTAFTPFVWPAASAVPMSSPTAQVIGSLANISADRVTNVEELTIRLSAGIDSPAGSNNDVIYWRAGKSFSVTNE